MDFTVTNRIIENLEEAYSALTWQLQYINQIADSAKSNNISLQQAKISIRDADLSDNLNRIYWNLTARRCIKFNGLPITDIAILDSENFKSFLKKIEYRPVAVKAIESAIKHQQPTFEEWEHEYYNNYKELGKEAINEIYCTKFKGVLGCVPVEEFELFGSRLNGYAYLRKTDVITISEIDLEMIYFGIAWEFNSLSKQINNLIGLNQPDEIENVSNELYKLSVADWALIYHCLSINGRLPELRTETEKRRKFIEDYRTGIQSENSFKNKVSEIYRQVADNNKCLLSRLTTVRPWIIHNAPDLIGYIDEMTGEIEYNNEGH